MSFTEDELVYFENLAKEAEANNLDLHIVFQDDEPARWYVSEVIEGITADDPECLGVIYFKPKQPFHESTFLTESDFAETIDGEYATLKDAIEALVINR